MTPETFVFVHTRVMAPCATRPAPHMKVQLSPFVMPEQMAGAAAKARLSKKALLCA